MFSFDRRGAIRALFLVIPGLILLVVGRATTARVLGLLSSLVFLFFAYVNEYGSRPDRELPPEVAESLERIPRVRGSEHKVDLVLDDGSVAYGVTVTHGKFVELPLGRPRLRFDPHRVVSARKMKDPG
jgi:hypothetical protein